MVRESKSNIFGIGLVWELDPAEVLFPGLFWILRLMLQEIVWMASSDIGWHALVYFPAFSFWIVTWYTRAVST